MTCTLESKPEPMPMSPENRYHQRLKVLAALFATLALIFALACLLRVASARMKENTFKQNAYASVPLWLKSAESTLKNGTFLTLVNDRGQIIPIEENNHADDLGQVLILNLRTYISQTPTTLWTVAKINVIINVIAFVLLSLTFLYCRMILPAILILLMGAWVGIPYFPYTPDNFAIHPGAYCLALILPILLVARTQVSLAFRWFDVLIFLLGGVSLAMSVLLRQPIGTIGVLVSILMVLYLALGEKPKRLAWATKYLAVLFFCISILFVPRGIIKLRNALFQLPPSTQVSNHGFSHTLYLGLGTEPNPWGIAWDDNVGRTTVQKINPTIRYCSEEYFSTLRTLYFRLLWNHPGEVLGIYLKKSGKMSGFHTRWLPGTLSWYLVFIPVCTGILLFGLYPLPQFKLRLLLNIVLFGFAALFLVQGILGMPHMQYISPVFFGILINLTVLFCLPLP